MELSDLTPAQAAEFRDHVVAREPYLLRELASWLDQTGGPIDAMDGSVASLVPLWEWCLEMAQADFLGLTDGLAPSTDPGLTMLTDRTYGELVRMSAVVGERLMHYLRLVVTRLHPATEWGVYHSPVGRREHDHQQTVLLLRGLVDTDRRERVLPVHEVEFSVAVAVQKNLNGVDRLEWIVVPGLPSALVPAQQDRLPSVLRPYLTAELPPAPEQARVSPVASWSASAVDEPAVARGGEDDLVLAGGPGEGLDDPRLLVPLPPGRVAAALRAGGFAGLRALDLRREDEWDHPDGVAHLMSAVHRGRLRAIHLERVDPTEESWERVVAPLRALAAELGVHLVPEGEYPD